MTYAWNSEALYFSSQCKVNANMESVMANFKDGHRTLKEPESIQKKDIWSDLGTKTLEKLHSTRLYRVGLFTFRACA